MRTFVHSHDPYLVVMHHTGQWRWDLPDGTFLIAVGHNDPAFARHTLEHHDKVCCVLPRRSDTAKPEQHVIDGLNALFKTYKYAQVQGQPNTHDFLQHIYDCSGDPMFHPDSSL